MAYTPQPSTWNELNADVKRTIAQSMKLVNDAKTILAQIDTMVEETEAILQRNRTSNTHNSARALPTRTNRK